MPYAAAAPPILLCVVGIVLGADDAKQLEGFRIERASFRGQMPLRKAEPEIASICGLIKLCDNLDGHNNMQHGTALDSRQTT